MIEGLIVAAGKSERTRNQYKMTLDFFGRTMLETTICSLAPFCSKIIVVVGYNAEKLARLLKDHKRLEIIYNPNYEAGMYSSVKLGLRHIQASRFFFLPGDCPLIPRRVFQEMLKIEANIVVPTYNNQPVIPFS